MDLAFVVLVFNGALLIVNEVDPFGASAFMATETTRADFDSTVPDIPDISAGGTEGSESFLRRGATSAGAFLGALANTIFTGSHINQIMVTAFNLPLPISVRVLLDAISGFIYAGAMYQIFLRFRTE